MTPIYNKIYDFFINKNIPSFEAYNTPISLITLFSFLSHSYIHHLFYYVDTHLLLKILNDTTLFQNTLVISQEIDFFFLNYITLICNYLHLKNIYTSTYLYFLKQSPVTCSVKFGPKPLVKINKKTLLK